jgi:SAM-dependent methyltransferase
MILWLRAAEQLVFEKTGVKVHNLTMLEIGPGQKLLHLSYFACSNDVIGIDLDEIAQDADIYGYWRMLRRNGPIRLIKTVGRKVLGIDRQFRKEMAKQLELESIPKLHVLAMDATHMTFPDESFDFILSHSVFEHLVEPATVIDEVVRVLKPGGAAYLSVHLYTSDSGCHDPRIFSGYRDGLPKWSHLRPQYAERVSPNAYLNKLRLGKWEELFHSRMPDVHFEYLQYDNHRFISELGEIRKVGELSEYTDLELLTVNVVAVWKKPPQLSP